MNLVIAVIVGFCGLAHLVSGRGVDVGLCGNKYFDCDCGTNGYKVSFPIKQCTFFYRWKPSCKPCEDIKQEHFCSKYALCSECVQDRCTKCPPNKYGQWCTGVCQCQNNGICKSEDGSCSCPTGFSGSHCEIKEIPFCRKPEVPLNGAVHGSNYQVGQSVTYTCNEGYVLTGETIRTCTSEVTWSGRLPDCEKSCPVLKLPASMTSEINPFQASSTLRSSTNPALIKYLRFKCATGYELIGPELLTCLPTGDWDRSMPACAKLCEEPKAITNGIIINPLGKVYEGTKIQYICNKDFTLIGQNENTCQKTGNWSHAHPKCQKLAYCTDPGSIRFAERKVIAGIGGGFSQEATIQYNCTKNAILIGQDSLECGKDGRWSNEKPSCIFVSSMPITCSTKGEEIYADINEPVRITCPGDCHQKNPSVWGTVIYRKESRVCAAAIHAGMIPKQGGSVFVINNGIYNLFVQSSSNGVKSTRHKSADESFRFEFIDEDPASVCPSGWTQAGKYCVAYINKAAPWDDANSICKNLESEMLVGNFSENAESKKLLSRIVPRTGLTVWFTDKVKSIINYKKDLINNLLTSTDRQPLAEPLIKENGNVSEVDTDGNSTAVNSTDIERESFNDTNTEDNSCGAVDDKSGIIRSDCESALNFVCRRDAKFLEDMIACDEPGAIPFGSSTAEGQVNEVYVEGSTVEYKCNPLYYISGQSKLTCTNNGTWSADKPQCIKVSACRNPPSIKNGFFNVLPALEIRSGTGRSGLSRAAASRTITTTTTTTTASPAASVDFPPGYHQIGTRVQFSCESRYYNLVGSSTRTCMSDSQWSGRQPTCQPVCGISSAPRAPYIVNGQPTKVGQWPWQVGLARYIDVQQSEQNKSQKEWYIMCGAALLTESWVVTASHCVTNPESTTLIPANELRLYFGKYYRNDSLDDDWIQVRQAQEIYINPDFNPVLYDGDIALIHLNNSVMLTSRVQPVCLPDIYSGMSDRHLQPGTIGVVTGWGLTEKGENGPTLLQADIPVVSSAECEEGYKEAGVSISVSGNMFCAGFESGEVRDACSGDSGGPFVMSEGTGVHERWYLEGIVSWGSPLGCGEKRQYGGYTKVSSFIDWIRQFI